MFGVLRFLTALSGKEAPPTRLKLALYGSYWARLQPAQASSDTAIPGANPNLRLKMSQEKIGLSEPHKHLCRCIRRGHSNIVSFILTALHL